MYERTEAPVRSPDDTNEICYNLVAKFYSNSLDGRFITCLLLTIPSADIGWTMNGSLSSTSENAHV